MKKKQAKPTTDPRSGTLEGAAVYHAKKLIAAVDEEVGK